MYFGLHVYWGGGGGGHLNKSGSTFIRIEKKKTIAICGMDRWKWEYGNWFSLYITTGKISLKTVSWKVASQVVKSVRFSAGAYQLILPGTSNLK